MSETSTRRPRAVVLGGVILLLFAAAGAIWGAFAPRSLEQQTSLGPMPVSPQDEVRVTGEVWLVLAAAVLGIIAMLLWWYVGPSRGPAALGWLAVLSAAGGAIALGAYVLVLTIRGDASNRVEGQDYKLLFAPSIWPIVIAPALIAVIGYTLAVIGARSDDLNRRGEDSPDGDESVGVTQDDAAAVVGWSGAEDAADRATDERAERFRC